MSCSAAARGGTEIAMSDLDRCKARMDAFLRAHGYHQPRPTRQERPATTLGRRLALARRQLMQER